MIEYMNADGETVTVLDLVTHITTSASHKLGVQGSFGSNEAFQSMTIAIPYGLPHETIRGLASDLYTECRSAVDARIADLLTRAAPVRSELDEAFGTKEERAADREAQKAAPKAPAPSGDSGDPVQTVMLQFPPKAGDRKPGQCWVLECDQYLLAGNKLEFWRSDSKGQYADAYISDSAPFWPTDWLPHMKNDGKKHEFAKPVLVTCSVSSKKSVKNNNYYVDVNGIEVKKEAAA